jgi:twitching motility protein PilT
VSDVNRKSSESKNDRAKKERTKVPAEARDPSEETISGRVLTGDGKESASITFEKICKAVMKIKASDLHLKANCPPRVRVGGRIKAFDMPPLSNEDIERIMFDIMTPSQLEGFQKKGSTDFAYQVGNSDRFRVNIFRARGLSSVAARRVPKEILDFEQLNLPPIIKELCDLHQGLVLVAGITGSGKSTTIAAMIDRINKSRYGHIVTLEDPIEFLFEDKKCFVNQREIGIDVDNFYDALKYLMREDPDVVLIGEMRDAETFEAALQAAETGHLCFGTVHANGAAGTITRILDLFPEEARGLVRQSLMINLQAVICLKLLPCLHPDFPRIPTCEVMINDSTIAKLIEEERDNEILSVMKRSYHDGMLDFNESLRRLVVDEMIEVKTAYSVSPNPDELKMRLKGISVAG